MYWDLTAHILFCLTKKHGLDALGPGDKLANIHGWGQALARRALLLGVTFSILTCAAGAAGILLSSARDVGSVESPAQQCPAQAGVCVPE